MESTQILTPRLRLKQLLSNKEGSPDLEQYHRVWSNDKATQWSPHGPCKTTNDSQAWMAGVIPLQDVPDSDQRFAFTVFKPVVGSTTQKEAEHRPAESFDRHPNDPNAWEAVGILTLLPLRHPPFDKTHPGGIADSGNRKVELGYLFLPDSWGLGYATESLLALLRWYLDTLCSADVTNRVELKASVHPDNSGSIRVLHKLGFQEVGRTEGEDIIYLGEAKRKNSVLHFRRMG
ncbi:GNAT domain-domain-containing protein [Microdochium bolleyi]|uniref:GNAT domain-domain-containing protein n=1 Tax=Microdochium bolleyi TaxID=196109 RepID=A0A136IKP7_9PEZI|nr:GNAT domain-domain-containing protein [Microdochium bolleyi]